MRIGIGNSLAPDMPEPALTPSPVAGDDGTDNFLGLFSRVGLEAPEERANVTNLMMGGLGLSVEEPEITSNFRAFLLIRYGNRWEKRNLHFITMTID